MIEKKDGRIIFNEAEERIKRIRRIRIETQLRRWAHIFKVGVLCFAVTTLIMVVVNNVRGALFAGYATAAAGVLCLTINVIKKYYSESNDGYK